MSVNLLEAVQNNLNYPPLTKIDPNTREVDREKADHVVDRFSQGAIPAVLTGIYSYSGTDEGAEHIRRGDTSSNWVSNIFGNESSQIVQQLATYSSRTYDDTLNEMNKIAAEAIRVIREQVTPSGTTRDVKDFLSNQTNNFLKYLPEDLRVGQAVNEEALDDNTNKMEGPISSLMHKIGSAFSKPSTEPEVNNIINK
jgi:hypothetical protein